MKTAIINIKVDPAIKEQAQMRAKKMGISLSSVLQADLYDFANGKSVGFLAENITPKLERELEQSRNSGAVGPFETIDDAIDYLKRVVDES